MKIFVLVSAIIELVFGAIFFFAPQLLPDFSDTNAGILALARAYGACAIALGILAIQTWRNMDNPVMVDTFLRAFLFFNIGVAAAFYKCYTVGVMASPAGVALHAVLGLITAYFFFVHRR